MKPIRCHPVLKLSVVLRVLPKSCLQREAPMKQEACGYERKLQFLENKFPTHEVLNLRNTASGFCSFCNNSTFIHDPRFMLEISLTRGSAQFEVSVLQTYSVAESIYSACFFVIFSSEQIQWLQSYWIPYILCFAIYVCNKFSVGHTLAQWLRIYATSRKVAFSRPDEVIELYLFN
jgi:hypothetical protein